MSAVDEAIRQQVFVEGFKEQEVEEGMSLLVPVLLKAFTDGLNSLNTARVRQIPFREARRQFNLLVEQQRREALQVAESLKTPLVEFAGEEYDFQSNLLEGNGFGETPEATEEQAYNEAEQNPVSANGDNLDEFLLAWVGYHTNRVDNLLNRAWANDTNNSDVIAQFRGTRARGYKDGLMGSILRRDLKFSLATGIQHISAYARKLASARNGSAQLYEWVSVLDSKTSATCRSLDGQVFKLNEGPVPPIHPNCRSTTVPVKGEKPGQKTSSRETYYEWLKRQPDAFQREVLGKSRAKLFQQGNISPQKFADLNLNRYFRPRTLEEMKKLAPVVFDKAGVTP